MYIEHGAPNIMRWYSRGRHGASCRGRPAPSPPHAPAALGRCRRYRARPRPPPSSPPSAAATRRGQPPPPLARPRTTQFLGAWHPPRWYSSPAGPPTPPPRRSTPRPDSRRPAHPASRRHSAAAACTAAASTAAATSFHKMPPKDRGHSATITSRSGTPTPSVPGTVGAAAPPVPTAHGRCHSTYHRHTLHQRMRCRRARRRGEPPIRLPCGRHPPGEGIGRHRRGQQHVHGADRVGR